MWLYDVLHITTLHCSPTIVQTPRYASNQSENRRLQHSPPQLGGCATFFVCLLHENGAERAFNPVSFSLPFIISDEKWARQRRKTKCHRSENYTLLLAPHNLLWQTNFTIGSLVAAPGRHSSSGRLIICSAPLSSPSSPHISSPCRIWKAKVHHFAHWYSRLTYITFR